MDQLEGEILQYETQLSQVQLAISSSPAGPEKNNLITLESDIKELIKLTKDSLQQLILSHDSDPLNAEYDLFKAEIAEIDSGLTEETKGCKSSPKDEVIAQATIKELNSDLQALEGTKCQAPYKYTWADDVTYHNALIFQVVRSENITECDDLKVKVVFTNPTHKEMLPCPYYLKGDCKFIDQKCRFSHGEAVLLKDLKDYKDPDFSRLTAGSRVLAKQNDNLWHRAVLCSVDGLNCSIKLESNSKEEEIPLHNVFPLDDTLSIESDSECDDRSEDDNDFCDAIVDQVNSEEIVKRILEAPPSSVLGGWEKYTKGFGSKLMAKMGYVHGSGLGTKGEGRVEPVPAVIFPAGKSLDHCMKLRENCGNDPDLFKAERKMKRIQRKHEQALNRAYEREKTKTNVFTFLNNKLGQSTTNDNTTSKQLELKNETTRELNLTSLHLSEEVRKTEKEIQSLNETLSRHSSYSKVFSVVKGKLSEKEAKLSQLKASEKRVSVEQEARRDRKKLSVF